MTNKRDHARYLCRALLPAGLMIGAIICSSGEAFTQSAGPSWSYTGSLSTPREGHSATLLPNGKVLVIGGTLPGTAELYDPPTGSWSLISFNPHVHGCVTLLPTGKLLLAGDGSGSAELYDPSNRTFTATGSMTEQAFCGSATLLTSGNVLITTWVPAGPIAVSAGTPELYDPSSGTFSSTGKFFDTGTASLYGDSGLVDAPATLLLNGKVLFAAEPTGQLYDPTSGTFSLTGSMITPCGWTRGSQKPSYIVGRTATLLRNGKVLVIGGANQDEECWLFRNAELYDPSTGTFTATSDMSRPRAYHTATLLPDGTVLITGGETYDCGGGGCYFAGSAPSTEIYDPSAGTFNLSGNMNTGREDHTATLLNNGNVLVAGGLDWPGGIGSVVQTLASAELYGPIIFSFSNPIDDPNFFVRQHYLDFLNRQPDANGLAFWTNEITSCGNDTQCIEVKRVNVSAAFFLSIEFQQTGYLVYRVYKASYGNLPDAPVPIRFNEFLPDTQEISHGVVVNQTGWEQLLESNKQAFMSDFVQRGRFTAAYPSSLTPDQFVDTLFANAGVTPSDTDRAAAINEFGSAMTTSDTAARSRALRRVAENSTLASQEFNRAFVLMQYFGYLRRNPNDAPDGNFDGYNFWLNKLNQFNGDFQQAEMVKAFLSSTEYRQQFPP